MNELITLVHREFEQDDIGQQIPIESSRVIYCNIKSVGRNDWYAAAHEGMKAALIAVVNDDDYAGEAIAEYAGKRYAIYRDYAKGKGGLRDLYLEDNLGV
ncbi:hypothetical protein SAMN04515656_11210 [Eubacterium aggregans]|uniref:Uncharacterized protein n=2 Tax=Eubacterium aggregans TaxID=81409 RepID=A0A1H4BND7_9FIRM|nr:hypothetical protein SAMN04515656_11210 [Eubacterium aggregans]